jgi:hypothetical protein
MWPARPYDHGKLLLFDLHQSQIRGNGFGGLALPWS